MKGILKIKKQQTKKSQKKKKGGGYFPAGPVVESLPSRAGGVGSIPGQGARIPHASWPQIQNIKNKKKKKKRYCNNKEFLKWST